MSLSLVLETREQKFSRRNLYGMDYFCLNASFWTVEASRCCKLKSIYCTNQVTSYIA
jgi:hypothetical protein